MWKPIYQPEPWPQFVKRKDIKGLPLMEQRKKYMQEQLLFENYLSTLNTLNTVSPSVSSAASGGGGPLPSTGGGDGDDWDIILKIDTTLNAAPEYWPTGSNFVQTQETIHMYLNIPGQSYTNTEYIVNDVTVDWGDGIVEENITEVNTFTEGGYFGGTGLVSGLTIPGFGTYPLLTHKHVYSNPGQYIIKLKGPGVWETRLAFLPIIEIIKYDPTQVVNGKGLFYQSQIRSQEVANQISSWDTSNWNSFRYMFWNRKSVNPESISPLVFYTSSILPNVENWDVSGVDNNEGTGFEFSTTFQGVVNNFGQDLSSWDSSTITGNSFQPNNMFNGCINLISGARADLWDTSKMSVNGLGGTFQDSMTSPEARGTMPHVGNWDLTTVTQMFDTFRDSGFHHTQVGETLIGWASGSVNNNINATRTFQNTWDGSGFSDPVFNTGSAFGLEVSASYDYLVTTKGWTITNISFT